MKLAVVGSGPAAVGVLTVLREKAPDASISVFDIDADRKPPFNLSTSICPPPPENERSLIKHIRANLPFSFPPPKSEFGLVAPKYDVDGKARIWQSNMCGGLSNLWGGLVLPFTDREMIGWPFSAEELKPYYQKIADLIGISGEPDYLNEYYPDDFANRPPIRLNKALTKLRSSIGNSSSSTDYNLVAGVARLALETRPERENCCSFGGFCMTGCSRHSIYNAAADLQKFATTIEKFEYISTKVQSIELARRTLKIGQHSAPSDTSSFDKIYLCAGCAGSTEILMRSLGISSGPIMLDNTIYTFPILYTGNRDPDDDAVLALTNLLIGGIPRNADQPMIHIQVYRTVDYYLRYYMPNQLWPLIQPLNNILSQRLYWARLYLPSDHSAAYAPRISSDKSLKFSLARQAKSLATTGLLIKELKQALSGSGFHLPMIPTIQHQTSSHYAGTFPYGGEYLGNGASGAISGNVYICDSTPFPNSPSSSPTLTIMANAARTAEASLND